MPADGLRRAMEPNHQQLLQGHWEKLQLHRDLAVCLQLRRPLIDALLVCAGYRVYGLCVG
jgi:hypothetical protein